MYAHMHFVRGTNSQIRDTRSLPGRSFRPMTFGKIASVRNGSEVICEVKAELRDGGAELGSCVMSSRL